MVQFSEIPGPHREQQILDAVKAGNYEHSWSEIASDHNGNHAKIWVSSDALKVEGVRVAVTAGTMQRIADILGASLCTTKIVDLAWEQATNRIKPQLQHADAHMSDWSRTVKHSNEVGAHVVPDKLSMNVGKHWILHNRVSTSVCVNYGWFADDAVYTSDSGHKLWQPTGGKHTWGANGTGHVDYSQTVILTKDQLEVNGTMVDLSAVLQDPNLAPLVNDGGILNVLRMPGVDAISHLHNEALTSLGERCVLWCENELARGIKEEPVGSNTGPRIKEYLRPCERNDQLLGLTFSPWCAAAQCCAALECLAPGEAMPHPYRASGFELEKDAKAAGVWVAPNQTPKRGDLGIFHRSNSDPSKADWERHVVRVTGVERSGVVHTVGGNQGNAWGHEDVMVGADKVICWVSYP